MYHWQMENLLDSRICNCFDGCLDCSCRKNGRHCSLRCHCQTNCQLPPIRENGNSALCLLYMKGDSIVLNLEKVQIDALANVCIQIETNVLIRGSFTDLFEQIQTFSNSIPSEVLNHIYNVCLQYGKKMPIPDSLVRIDIDHDSYYQVGFQFIRIESGNYWRFVLISINVQI
jgi:hypothetical protein